MKKGSIFEKLKRWFAKNELTLLTLSLYIPGYVLAAVFVFSRFGIYGQIALLLVEVWEILVFRRMDGTLSTALLPLILLHPYLCGLNHAIHTVCIQINPSATELLPDIALVRLRIAYVIISFVYIMVNRIISKHIC